MPRKFNIFKLRRSIVSVITFCSLLLNAQSLDTIKLNKYFKKMDSFQKFMGSVLISQNGQILYKKSIGYSNIELKTKNNDNTKYRIGSLSKTFTAVLVMKAFEERKLNLDAKLSTFFSKVKNADKITIINLLNHTSGIRNITNDSTYFKWNQNKKTETEMIDIISKYDVDFQPDSASNYSNSNYILLSYIVQKIYSKSYEQLLNEKIIQPLGLKHTKVGTKINPALNEALSYENEFGYKLSAETDLSIPMGAGNIISTPTDISKFVTAIFEAKIVNKESLITMTQIKNNYGYGLMNLPFYENIGYGHTGGIDGFNSMFAYYNTEKLCVVTTTNGSNFDNYKLSMALLSASFNRTYNVPNFKIFKLNAEDLKKYTGIYSSPQLPFKINFKIIKDHLVGQAVGQKDVPLECIDENMFENNPIDLTLKYNLEKGEISLNQMGNSITLKKEK